MTKNVAVIDYGLGNLFSVMRALEHLGASAYLTQDPADLQGAEAVVLPGVGAFSKGMQGLREKGFVEPLREYAASGRPLLGICLGMQMLASRSYEFGTHEGLGLIPGSVVSVEAHDPEGRKLKVPHIGWSPLIRPPGLRSWSGTILEAIPEDASTYFVHSYALVPDLESNRLADTMYGDFRVSAAVVSANVAGCQFHPERSGSVGLKVLARFVSEGGTA